MKTRSYAVPELAVSVIIPTRNRAAVLLPDVLAALAKQTLQPERYEVIVVDNLSTDNTEEVVTEFAKTVKFKLSYHRMPVNRGPAPSRNTGVRMTSAPILGFIDDDCRPSPEWLEAALEAFESDAALISGTVRYKPEQTAVAGFFSRDQGEVLEEHPSYSCTNVLYRRSVFEEFGGFDENLCLADFRGRSVECSDTDLAWRVKNAGFRSVFAPRALVYHELEQQKLMDWLFNPWRLTAVAHLIKRHPILRAKMLHWNYFFLKENAFFYLALIGTVLAVAVHWGWAVLTVPFLSGIVRLATFGFSLRRAPKIPVQVLLLTARHAIFCAVLIYGSVRFRSLVL